MQRCPKLVPFLQNELVQKLKLSRISKLKVVLFIQYPLNLVKFRQKVILILYTQKLILHNQSHAKVYARPGDRNAFSQVIMISVIALVDDEGP